ncbi:MAG: SagB/ThcOx family dehydrogenase [Planctomycetota bacterium]|nr:SagB/ThcOx family dehydrogenase [Planctomycetota bacterium]
MKIELPQPNMTAGLDLFKAIRERRSIRSYADEALDPSQISDLLFHTSGITGDRPRMLASPSAGAIHAIKTYLIAYDIQGIEKGIYVYDKESHSLEQTFEGDVRQPLSEACFEQKMFTHAPAVVAFSVNIDRIRQRYRERSPRYAAMDCGHYGHNIYLVCEALGLATVAVGAFDDDAANRALAVSDEEQVYYIFPIGEKNNE